MENFYDNFGNVYSPQALPINRRLDQVTPTYQLGSGHITFNVKEGKVCMAYLALPMDKEGFPFIPDDVKYKRACSSYLQWKLDYILWRTGIINNAVYKESKDEYEWAIASAIAHIKTPDVNQAESLRRQLTKMIVRNEDFRTGFVNMNSSGLRGRY